MENMYAKLLEHTIVSFALLGAYILYKRLIVDDSRSEAAPARLSADPSHKQTCDPAAARLLLGESRWADAQFCRRYQGSALSASSTKVATAAPSGLPSPASVAALIRRRRSIFPKDFTGQQVPLAVIEEILLAANWAPTHGKTEPWRFVVAGSEAVQRVMDIRDRFMTVKLTGEGDTAGLAKHKTKMARKRTELQKCAVVIFIVVKRVRTLKGRFMPEWEEVAAVSCAVQNLHLQLTAHWDKGIGGYWSSGGYNSWMQAPEMRQLVGAGAVGAPVSVGSNNDAPPDDLVLGGFYLGVANPKKMGAYRAKRGKMANKVKWVF